MGQLPGVVAHPDAPVERRRTEPDGPAFLTAVEHLPQPHVVALAGAVAGGQFISDILRASVEIERADRRRRVRAAEQDTADDRRIGTQGQRIGRKPAGRMQAPRDVVAVAHHADIQGIAPNAIAGAGHHRFAGQPRLVLVMCPQCRQQQIGRGGIQRQQHQQQRHGASQASSYSAGTCGRFPHPTTIAEPFGMTGCRRTNSFLKTACETKAVMIYTGC